MKAIYIPIFALVFLIGYLIGSYRSGKSDGVLYVETVQDDENKCTWLGMKIYDTNGIYSKDQVQLDIKRIEPRRNYTPFSEKEDSK